MVSVRIEIPETLTVPVYGGDDANPLAQDVTLDVTKLGPEALTYLFTYGVTQQRDVYSGVKKGGKRADGTVLKTDAEVVAERVRALAARFTNLIAGQLPRAGGGGPSVGIPHWDTFRAVVQGAFKKRSLTLDLKALIADLRAATNPDARQAVLRARVYTPIATAKAGRNAKASDIDAVRKAVETVVAERVKRAEDDMAGL